MKRKVHLNAELKNIEGIEYAKLNGEGENKYYPALTRENVIRVHKYVTENSSYSNRLSDDFVAKYFREHKDQSLASIITKIILIDTVDSTNLKRLLGKNYYIELAERIQKSNIESLIKEGKPIGEKFKEIASFPPPANRKFKKDDFNFFIFLSKYITRTNQYSYGRNDYSIMDSVVREYLPLYASNQYKVSSNDLSQMRNNYLYDDYCQELGKIVNALGNDVDRVMLDHFIWFSFKEEAAGDKEI